MTTIVEDRLETLVVAKLATSGQPVLEREVQRALARFAPAEVPPSTWKEHVAHALAVVREWPTTNWLGELVRLIGNHAAPQTWSQLCDRILPALALGIEPSDTASHRRLIGRDAWAAAIVGRALELWTAGPPPSLTAVCDAMVWHKLGLTGRPKRSPPEVRAHFVGLELQASAAPPDRLVRLLAARTVGAPRPELRALRDALVRRWLVGAALGSHGRELADSLAPVIGSGLGREFAAEVGAVARSTRDGVFGDRKVFIASVWRGLRERPAWAELSLDDFKRRLLDAHRAGQISLARADLVSAMDPELVAASETVSANSRFHFVVREAP